MRGPATAALLLVRVTCWPTIGAKVVSKASMNCSRSRALRIVDGEDLGPQEIEHRGDAAVVQKTEAANLIALILRVAGQNVGEMVLRRAEHADLLVGVLQLRNLELLRSRPRMSSDRSVPKRPCDAFERVTAGAVRGAVDDGAAVEEQAAASGLRGGQLVVEAANRVGRRHDLQHEVGKRLHVGVGRSGPRRDRGASRMRR